MTRAERWASIDAILHSTLLMDNKAAHRYITERARYRVLQRLFAECGAYTRRWPTVTFGRAAPTCAPNTILNLFRGR